MNSYLKTILLYTIAVAMLAACSTDDDNTTTIDEPLAEYTIMAYGSAGGNLDPILIFNLEEVKTMGYQESVQFTALYKHSSIYQELSSEYEGTRLYTMEASGEISNTKVGDADFRLDEPQNIADFIEDAKRRLPAKKYILIMDNHGSGFDIRDQPVETSYEPTKAICFDDNTDGSSVSIFEFEAALELVGEKIDMLYWNACLMNAIENNYQIHSYFDYILGQNNISYDSNYAILINSLLKYDNIADAGQYYAKKLVEMWGDYEIEDNCDITLIECAKMERVVELIGEACDILCDYRDNLVVGSSEDYRYKYFNGDSSDSAKWYYCSNEYNEENPTYLYTEGGMHYFFCSGYSMIDLCLSMRCFSSIIASGELSAITTLLNDAVDDMYICREYINPSDRLNDVSVSICWTSDVAYNYAYDASNGFEINTLSELYALLDFDKATGWGSRYLAGNVVQAVGYDYIRDAFYNIER